MCGFCSFKWDKICFVKANDEEFCIFNFCFAMFFWKKRTYDVCLTGPDFGCAWFEGFSNWSIAMCGFNGTADNESWSPVVNSN